MTERLVTVAVVPRERFSFVARSLENVLSNTDPRVGMVYVDGGSPPHVREYLEREARKQSFCLLRSDHYLSPNAARNMAASHVRTRYVAFIDNDAITSPNWLAPLVDCAESTGAWVVGPIYCEGEPVGTRVHMAGGTAAFVNERGRRMFRESHRFFGRSLQQIRPRLRREAVEQVEFHCALVRMEALDRLGPLDEQLLSAAEHTDLSLLARSAGGTVYMEPNSVVTYVPPPPFEPSDLPYFQLRWSHAWNEASLARFREKWRLDEDDPWLVGARSWLAAHRRLALEPYRQMLRVFGRQPARLMEKLLIGPLEEAANRARFHFDPPLGARWRVAA